MSTETKRKRKPRGPEKPKGIPMAKAVDRLLVTVLRNGVPVFGPGGEPIADAEGRVLHRPASAAFVSAALRRMEQIHRGILTPKGLTPGAGGVGDILAALSAQARNPERGEDGELGAGSDDDDENDAPLAIPVHLGRQVVPAREA